jgi:hypothetical protein
MQLSFQWRCATCGHESDADSGFCPRCGARAGPPTVAERWNREHPDDPMLAARRARSGGRLATGSRSPGVRGLARQRPRWLVAIVSTVLGIVVVLALSASGTFRSGSIKSAVQRSAAAGSRAPGRPHSSAREREPRPKPLVAADSLGAHRVFAGRAFSIAYPRGWTVTGAEAPAPWGTDTTIIAPGDPHMMVRVDVVTSPGSSDPFTVAEPVIAGVAGEPGYRALGLASGTFERRPAALWEFRVAETGVMVRKQDVFFTPHAGTVIALLTAAPANRYESLARRFTAIRRSFVARR